MYEKLSGGTRTLSVASAYAEAGIEMVPTAGGGVINVAEAGADHAWSDAELHANDAIGLLDYLGLKRVHLMGLVGMGACVCQEIAIRRPDLARSMLNMGAWCEVDDFLRDQLEMFRWIHRDLGFYDFQKAVTLLSFDAEFYNANKARLLGPELRTLWLSPCIADTPGTE